MSRPGRLCGWILCARFVAIKPEDRLASAIAKPDVLWMMMLTNSFKERDGKTTLRRRGWRFLGVAAAGALFAASTFGQGRCRDGYGTQACPLSEEVATAPIEPIFASTGWKTVALDHITFEMADYQKEAAFYVATMGWKVRSDDGKQAVLDIANWGSAIFKQAPER